jgi:hypothetical protein
MFAPIADFDKFSPVTALAANWLFARCGCAQSFIGIHAVKPAQPLAQNQEIGFSKPQKH